MATTPPVVSTDIAGGMDDAGELQQNYREIIAADQALYTQRQRQLHDAAAMRHVANSAFTPHSRMRKVTQAIDDFCRDDSMNESKPPLVLVGEVGSGKSCILANWVRDRRLRSRGVSSGASQEFVFLHVAGCSRDSTTVSNVLFRIVTEIKHHFGLQMEISEREQKLSWEFIRALDTASRKGRVIVVIDGLNRLHSRGFAGLKWLPLHFPANVRVIISTTATPADVAACREDNKSSASFFLTQPVNSSAPRGKKKKKSRDKNLAEVMRRKWPIVQVQMLEPSDRAAILRRFLESKSDTALAGGGRPGGDAGGGAGDGTFMTELTGGAGDDGDGDDGDDDGSARARSGQLTLLRTQQLRLIDSPCAKSPLFLRVTLEALKLAASEGMDVCAVLEDCIGARSLAELYEVVLRRWTRGCAGPPVDHAAVAEARRREQQRADEEAAAARSVQEQARRAEAEAGAERKLKELDDAGSDGKRQGGGFDPNASAIDMLVGEEAGSRPGVGESKSAPKIGSGRPVPLYGGHLALSADIASDPAVAAAIGVHTGPRDATKEEEQAAEAKVEADAEAAELAFAAGGGFQPKTLDATTSSYSLVSTTGGNGDRPQTVLGSGPRAAQREALAEAMRQEAAAKGGMPSYLTGGTAVAGLGPVLGAALCFLYSSRHGLLEDEMKQLLLQEVRIEGSAPISVDDPALFTRLRHLLSTVLGASSVGSMFSLPPLCATLRSLVHRRYLNRGKGLWRVQQALIGYHSRAMVTPRRAEELPWLLERRRSWSALKDVLLDLEMFEILWTPTHKFDLFRYWGILTGAFRDNGGGDFGGFGGGGGSDAEEEAAGGDDAGEGGAASPMNKSAVSGEAMRKADIVDEYNKAVENWYYSAGRPTVADLQYVLLRIEDFFYHFAEQEGNTPHFVHRPLADVELDRCVVGHGLMRLVVPAGFSPLCLFRVCGLCGPSLVQPRHQVEVQSACTWRCPAFPDLVVGDAEGSLLLPPLAVDAVPVDRAEQLRGSAASRARGKTRSG